MLEIKVTIEAPELTGAINNLAAAMGTAAGAVQVPYMPVPVPDAESATTTQQVTYSATEPQQTANPSATAPVTAAPTSLPATTPSPSEAESATPAPVKVYALNETGKAAVRLYTLDEIGRAGAALVDQGKMPQVIALLGKFGVQTIQQLKPDQYSAVAEELKALGASL